MKPDGNYLIYSYDSEWFNGADPTKMSPREIFDSLYGKDSEYNPYNPNYRWGNNGDNSTVTTTDELYQTITTTTTTLGWGMTTTGTIPLYQTLIYEDESGKQRGLVYTGKDLIMDADDWYDIIKGGAMIADGVKVEIRDGKAIVYGREGVGRVLSGLRGRIYGVNNPLIQEFSTAGGAMRNAAGGTVVSGVLTFVIDTTDYLTGGYNSPLNYTAHLGKDLTVVGISSGTGILVTGGTTALCGKIGGGIGALAGPIGMIVGAGVGIGVGYIINSKFGNQLVNFWKGIISGTENAIYRLNSFVNSTMSYIMSKIYKEYGDDLGATHEG